MLGSQSGPSHWRSTCRLRHAGLDVGVNVMHLNYDVHGYYAQLPALEDIRKVCCKDLSCYARRS